MAPPDAKSSKAGTDVSSAGKGKSPSRYFALVVSVLFFVALFGGVLEFVQHGHRPNPFTPVEPVTSWQWWRYPIPAEATDVMPWPIGVQGHLVPRGNYDESHGITVKPGQASVQLAGVGEVELANLQLFKNSSAWALAADGTLYAKPADGDWQPGEIKLPSVTKAAPAESRISGQELFSLGSKTPITWATYSPDGEVIVTLSEGSILEGWDSESGKPLWRLPPEKFGNFVGIASFHPESTLSVIPARYGAVVFDWRSGDIFTVVRGGKGVIGTAVFAPDGRVVIWSEDMGLWLAGLKGGGFERQLDGNAGPVTKIAFSPDGRVMAALSRADTVLFYDYPSGKRVGSFNNEGRGLQDFVFTSNGDAIVAADDIGTVQVVEVRTPNIQRTERFSKVLDLSGSNDTVLAQIGKGELGVWNYIDRGLSPEPQPGFVIAAVLSPTGDLIAAELDDGRIHVFGLGGSRLSAFLDTRGPRAKRLIFSPNGTRLLVSERDGPVRLFDVSLFKPEPKPATELVPFEGRITGIHFVNSRVGWLIADNGRLIVTKDAGATWLQQALVSEKPGNVPAQQELAKQPLASNVTRRGLNDVHFLSERTGWVVGDSGFLARTVEGGTSWTKAEPATNQDLLAVSFATPNAGLAVGRAGTILRTRDGGQSWQPVETGVPYDLHAVLLQSNNVGWAVGVVGNGELPRVLQTLDGGANWTAVDYSELPAPWLLFLGIPVLALAGFLATYRKSQTLIEQGVDPAGASDKPIGWDDPDPLKFHPIAKGLSSFLRNPKTEPPLTIGINGPWGTGKSSLMNLVMEDLRQYGCRPVWFNAWHHQKEEHLLAALLENIRKQAVPRLWQRGSIGFRCRLLWRRTQNELVALGTLAMFLFALLFTYEMLVEGDGLGDIVNTVIALTEPSAESQDSGSPQGPEAADTALSETINQAGDGKGKEGDNPTSLLTLDGINNLLRQQGGILGASGTALIVAVWLMLRLRVLPSDPAKLMAALSRRVTVRDLRDQLGFRYNFGSEFKQVCTALQSRISPGLVILIDDLDRCQPQNVLEVLEAVNFLASVGDCFIILGMARRQVENCIAVGFKDFIVEGVEEEEYGLLHPGPAGNRQAVNGQEDGATESTTHQNIVAANGSDPDPSAENGVDRHATNDQRRFAQRYLEKLINIEVAVPRGNPDQAAGLFTPDETDSGTGKRLHRRQLLYTVFGLGQLLAVGLFLGTAASWMAPLFAPSSQLTNQIAQGNIVTSPDGIQSKPTPKSEPTGSKAKSEAGRTPQPAPTPKSDSPGRDEAAQPVPIPPVQNTSLATKRPWWAWWGPPALIVVFLTLVAIRRRLRPPDTNIEDTEAFTKALQRWYPLIYAFNPTPRGIKRFENRVRFLAMQAHPPQQVPDAIDRIIDRLERTRAALVRIPNRMWAKIVSKKADVKSPNEPPAQGPADATVPLAAPEGADYQIKDEMLVALSTVETLASPILRGRNAGKIRQLVDDKIKELESILAPAKWPGNAAYRKQLGKLKADIGRDRPWRPSARDLTDYHRLSGLIRD